MRHIFRVYSRDFKFKMFTVALVGIKFYPLDN